MKTSIPPSHEHPFAQYVRILGKGKKGTRSLTSDEAFAAMSMIMDDECLDVQLGAFLMLLRVKEESPDELLGFVRAVRRSITPEKKLATDLDWSSYAGKRRHLPWYLLTILLLAQQQQRIFIHGASGHTIDRLYTEDVFNTLGLPVAASWQQTEQQLTDHGFCYFPLRSLCPKLHRIIELRNTMGLRSPVHTLARLLNPTDAPCVIQGIFHPGYRPVHQLAAQALGYQRVAVIKGDGGEIERDPDIPCLVQSVRGDELSDHTWPAMFSKRHLKESSLDASKLAAVWQGRDEDEYGIGATVGTAAIAIELLGLAETPEQAMTAARDFWQQRDRTLL